MSWTDPSSPLQAASPSSISSELLWDLSPSQPLTSSGPSRAALSTLVVFVVSRSVKKQNVTKKPPLYRVLLHNDATNKREYVVRVLLKVMSVLCRSFPADDLGALPVGADATLTSQVVDGMTVDLAVNIMQARLAPPPDLDLYFSVGPPPIPLAVGSVVGTRCH